MLCHQGANRRAGNTGDAPDAAGHALDASALFDREEVADDRQHHRQHGPGAEALDGAEEDELLHRLAEAAEPGAEQKQRATDKEDWLAAVEVCQLAVERYGDRRGQKIDGEDPAKKVEPAEVANDGRNCRGDDR